MEFRNAGESIFNDIPWQKLKWSCQKNAVFIPSVGCKIFQQANIYLSDSGFYGTVDDSGAGHGGYLYGIKYR